MVHGQIKVLFANAPPCLIKLTFVNGGGGSDHRLDGGIRGHTVDKCESIL